MATATVMGTAIATRWLAYGLLRSFAAEVTREERNGVPHFIFWHHFRRHLSQLTNVKA